MLKVRKRPEKKERLDEVIDSDLNGIYFKDIRKVKKLTSEEEKVLWETYFINGDRKIIEKIVKNHIRFAISTANEFKGVCEMMNLDVKDLYQEASYGLMVAADKFTLDKKVKFISYAVWWIRQSIFAYLSEYSREIRLPLNIVNDLQKQQKSNDEKLKNNEFVDNSENIDVPTVQSIYSTINDDGDELIDLIQNNSIDSPDNVDKFDRRKELEDLMNDVLDEREKLIVTMYYGFNGEKNCNLEDVGDEVGLTKERVRQIKEIALKKLRTNAKKLFILK